MRLTATKEQFLPLLQKTAGIVGRTNTLPILNNIKLEAKDGFIHLTATDLEVQLAIKGEVTEVIEEGAVTVPAKKLLDVCRLLPANSNMLFEVIDEERLKIQVKKSRYTFSTLPADNYPQFDMSETEQSVTLPVAKLQKLMDKTGFCMASEDVRYYLNGMMFEVEGDSIRAVTSDGHRLAKCEDTLEETFETERQVIIPRRGILELQKLLTGDEVTLLFSANSVCVKIGDISFAAKLIDGKFPDWRRVMPAQLDKKMSADVSELKSAISRAMVLSNDRYKGLRIDLSESGLEITATNPENEEAVEQLEVSYEGDTFTTGFNGIYLLASINTVDSNIVKFSFNSQYTALIEDEADSSFLSIVMPMRL